MNLTNYLADIWGVSLVVVPLALILNEKFLKGLFAEIENDATMLFWGTVTLVIGLAMILSYNVWDKNWQVVITILGWLSLLKGLAVLFLPELTKKYARKIENAKFLPYALLIVVLIGLAVTYFGFTAQ